MPTAQGFEVQPSTASGAQPFHADDLTIDGLLALVQRVKVVWGIPGAGVDASAANPLPVTDAAGEASLVSILAKLNDPATQTTLAAVLAKLPTAPALDATVTSTAATNHTDLAAILAKQPSTPALDGTDGATPPAVPGTGIRGWLRSIYDKLNGTLTISGSVAPSVAGDGAGTLTDGRKTVTTPGTAVALATTSTCKWVAVTALPTNTQQVNVGGSGALAASGTQTGTPLAPGSSVTIPVTDPSKVFVDARVASEGVSYTVGS